MAALNGYSATGKWERRFMKVTVIQALLAVGLTAFLLWEGVFGVPAASKIVAGGGAGTWLTVGYFGFLVLGPMVMAITALFYRYVEVNLAKRFGRVTGALAWLHLVLWNVGVVGSTWLMMNAGYRGGAAAMAVSSGGLGWSSAQVHSGIMAVYPPYIAAFMAIALAGIGLGILSGAYVWARSTKAEATAETPLETPAKW